MDMQTIEIQIWFALLCNFILFYLFWFFIEANMEDKFANMSVWPVLYCIDTIVIWWCKQAFYICTKQIIYRNYKIKFQAIVKDFSFFSIFIKQTAFLAMNLKTKIFISVFWKINLLNNFYELSTCEIDSILLVGNVDDKCKCSLHFRNF